MQRFLRHGIIQYLLLLLVALLVRLPHILSENFVLDGDEAIVGLMVQAFIERGELSAFFWGQNYGFVLPELLLSGLFASVFGLSAYTLKLPMLLLFALGVLFIFKTIEALAGKHWAWMLALLVAIAPTWFLWGMRPRGGYIAAFVLAHAVIYFSTAQKQRSLLAWISCGLLCGLTFISHALWLPGAAFFALAGLIHQQKPFRSLTAVSSGFVAGIFPLLASYQNEVYHQPSFFNWSIDQLSFNSSVYWSFLVRSFNGIYLHGKAFTALWSVNLFAIVCIIGLAMFVISMVIKLSRKPTDMVMGASLLSISSLLLWPLFLSSPAPALIWLHAHRFRLNVKRKQPWHVYQAHYLHSRLYVAGLIDSRRRI
ncbi:MAG: glycosyltransferase family 39 protein [Salibacteraceae bacterium]